MEAHAKVVCSGGGHILNIGFEMGHEKWGSRKGVKSSDPSKNTNDGARAKQATLKIVLGAALGYGLTLSEHIILDASLIPNTKSY